MEMGWIWSKVCPKLGVKSAHRVFFQVAGVQLCLMASDKALIHARVSYMRHLRDPFETQAAHMTS